MLQGLSSVNVWVESGYFSYAADLATLLDSSFDLLSAPLARATALERSSRTCLRRPSQLERHFEHSRMRAIPLGLPRARAARPGDTYHLYRQPSSCEFDELNLLLRLQPVTSVRSLLGETLACSLSPRHRRRGHRHSLLRPIESSAQHVGTRGAVTNRLDGCVVLVRRCSREVQVDAIASKCSF